ncbi:MAG: recombinase family protein [Candidatus Heimdallarchaeaceae archaeon]
MKNYIGYVRVSTRQQLSGHSIEYQKNAIQKYCQDNNINLVKVYFDKGISAVVERPAFTKAMERIKTDKDIHGMIVFDLTRFGRSITDIYTNVNIIREQGKELVILKQNFVVKKEMDAISTLMFNLLASFAEFERETILDRFKAGRERAKIKGTKSGKPMHRPPKPIDWDRVKELRGYGLSWTRVAKIIGVSPPTMLERARKEGYYDRDDFQPKV